MRQCSAAHNLRGWRDKNDPGFQKMQQLVEKWVVEEQQKCLKWINAKPKGLSEIK